ncbi:MAG: hypothetical protein CFE33_09410 [Pseudorhodobacter sp. PARRP1]|nr:MAG: hypothetical protein CFE33_09410 [Pseudorhodobacter sp. PARRP1]
MGPAQAIRVGFSKSFQYSGRASRPEFWWFAGFWLALSFLVKLVRSIAAKSAYDPDSTVSFIAVLLICLMSAMAVGLVGWPLLAVARRRAQDVGVAGKIFALSFAVSIILPMMISTIPSAPMYLLPSLRLVGPAIAIALLLLCLLPSRKGPNHFGPNPSEVTP